MKYRPEVDGLRAVAVVPVVLFHAGLGAFSGGFVGVDVFFVISGYLITLILIGDIEAGQFSLLNFYERRARRILPALFLVMAVCLPFAWLWMLPSELLDFSESLAAVSMFGSNILFWREAGYFEAASEAKPLLHTWSLAVEEQYYLIFPIFLFLAWRLGRGPVFYLSLALIAASLALSEWGWRNSASANFYLLPTRLWELLAGSVAAYLVHGWGGRQKENSALSFLGLGAIIACIFLYDADTPFPSLYTLIPVLGAVLILLFAGPNTLTAQFLSLKGIVAIGLISYSAYLWHQPLLAFGYLRSFGTLDTRLSLALGAVAFPLAWLSWKYVEQPFRNRARFSRRAIFGGSAAGLALFFVVGVAGYAKKGFPGRLDVVELPFLTMQDAAGSCFDRTEGFCNLEDPRPKIIIIGDSTMQPLATALQAVQQDYAVVPVTAEGCILAQGHGLRLKGQVALQPSCWHGKAEDVLALLQEMDGAAIVYGGMFSKALTGYAVAHGVRDKPWRKEFVAQEGADALEAAMGQTVQRLDALGPALFFVEFPEFGIDVHAIRARQALLGIDSPPMAGLHIATLRSLHAPGADLQANLARITGGVVVDAFAPACPGGRCTPFQEGMPLYTDQVHPSEVYAQQVARMILSHLEP